ncbi:Agmatine deiminase [Planctomycetes bacterium K23_9]|uniref:Agmatine deiminase n=2 Tax=Stieleria marina TaxID=1930275 RepID=A0A517NTI3_9BACT|nr:Agmatine deiminase [Planctomycetes bacterium K23_9]
MQRKKLFLATLVFAFGTWAAVSFALRPSSPPDTADRDGPSEGEFGHLHEFSTTLMSQMRSDHRDFVLRMARKADPSIDDSIFVQNFLRSFTHFTQDKNLSSLVPEEVGAVHHHLGMLHAYNGDYRSAEQNLNKSINIAVRDGDVLAAAHTKNTLACVLASIGKPQRALELLQEALPILRKSQSDSIAVAIVLRNIGVLQHATGIDGTASLKSSISQLGDEAGMGHVGLVSDLSIDFKMILCKQLWSQGDLAGARSVCGEVRDDLTAMAPEIRGTTLRKDVVSPNQYANARRFVKYNLTTLINQIRAQQTEIKSDDGSLQSSDAWVWRPLLKLRTELVPNDSALTATMKAEFEPQSSLTLAWGMRQWTHQATLDIAKAIHGKVGLIVLADNDESLAEARSEFTAANIPAADVQFRVYQFESPWFRDAGPIVGETASGNTIWFDSQLAREGALERCAFDAIPQFLSRSEAVGLVDTALYVEGGAVLSDGQGLTACSSWIFDRNRELGIEDAQIVSELRRIAGTKILAPLEPLDGESTGHIDLFMTIPAPRTIVIGQYKDADSTNGKLLDEHANRLAKAQVDGDKINVVRVPMPENSDGVMRTYTNVIYANGILLVPSYPDVDQSIEQEVERVYRSVLPNWKIKFIDCSQIVRKGGALHCLVSNLGYIDEKLPSKATF